jgi:hypothetical protein
VPKGIYIRTEEAKKNMRLARLGKHLSEETKKKLSELAKKENLSIDRRLKISESHKGNKNRLGHYHSKETKEKIRLANSGEKCWCFGKKQSEETRKKLSEAVKGENNSQWKGGRIKNSGGYILIKNLKHPFASLRGYVSDHRLVMEEFIGRYLTPEEVVHHVNGIKDDNRLENLMLFDDDNKHKAYHHQLKKLAVA